MGKHRLVYFFYASLLLVLCTCKDPVFYAISQEVKPIEPRIKGVPTDIVIYDGRMYVASGDRLYSYNKGPDKPYWINEASPGGNIMQIASTGSNLYALCATNQNNDGRTVIKIYNKDDSTWSQFGGILDEYPKLHNIFAAGDILFVMATSLHSNFNSIYYTVLYINNGTVEVLKNMNPDRQNDTGEINGAAYKENENIYFLSAKNRGVYRIINIDEGAELIRYHNAQGSEINVNFMGIINLKNEENTVLLIARNGEIYTVNDSIVKIDRVSMSRMATGALAIWRENDQPDGKRLLLAGRQDSLNYSTSYSYAYGYLELELDESGVKTGSNFTEPGRSPLSTLTDYERYKTTLGKNPINYLFQVPSDIDSNMILFASTQKNGFWSCRDRKRDYNKYWNAEGENEPEY